MRLLLDTHVFLWWIDAGMSISPLAEAAVGDENNRVLFSHASVREITIKESTGKLPGPGDVRQICQSFGFELLPIRIEHIECLRRLPLLHRDPFDRMLIAQALTDELTLVTRDGHIARYPGVLILKA